MPKRKSCKKGYSRNKSTGRCRKIRKSAKSKKKCRSKKYLNLAKMSKRISKKLKKLSKKMSKAAKRCRSRRRSGSRRKSRGRRSAGRRSGGRRSAGSRRKSPVKGFKEYEVAVEYYSPPNFKKSKYGNLIMNLESVMDEDENGINIYYHLARVKALNRANLLKYLNGIGNLKRIIAIDEI
jgi:hypothetical protein